MGKVFRFNFLTVVISVIFGGAWALVGSLLYNLLKDVLWMPLLIALYITGLAFAVFVAILVSNSVCKNAKPDSKQYQKTLILIGIIFVCSMLFEFLYELSFSSHDITDPTSYIFLIDDSGSMSSSDPGNARHGAIYDILKDCDDDFPYAIYSFSHEFKQVVPISPASTAQNNSYYQVDGGGTDILGALKFVLNDIDSGNLVAGACPRVLLLSDGESGEYGLSNVVRECVSKNVSVSTVGFGSANVDFLNEIARKTGGFFVWVDDIGKLSNGMNEAISAYLNSSRNLLDYRIEFGNNALYAVLRIAFMLIIAAGFVLIKVFMFSTFDEKNVALYTFSILAALGAVGIEVGINALDIAPGIMRTIMCIFFAVLLGSSKNANSYQNGNGGAGTGMGNGTPIGGGFYDTGDKHRF